MFIRLQILLLKLNAVLVQASIISVFIVHFLNVVLITLFLYIRFKITLMVLFKGTLVTSDVTLCHWVYIALILLVVSNKILDLSQTFSTSIIIFGYLGRMRILCLQPSSKTDTSSLLRLMFVTFVMFFFWVLLNTIT